MKHLLPPFLGLLIAVSSALGAAFDVTAFGAKGDGATLCTAAIQRAIDAAAQEGKSRVVFPKGTYLSGALFVKSGVELVVDEGVTLSAVRDDSAYPEIETRIAGIEMKWPAALVNVYRASDVKISGLGVIDGQGDFWWEKFWGKDRRSGMLGDYAKRGLRWAVDYDCKRVRAVALYDSKNVDVKGVTINRSGFWSLSITYCENVRVADVVIRANIGGVGPSSDGIDIDSSRWIVVERCDIDCNDDNICLKAGRDAEGLRVNRPTEGIIIRDCVTRSGHGMLAIGSETSGGIRNVDVSGLRAVGTRAGIRFKSAKIRGGVVENIRISDVEMQDVPSPLRMELNWNPGYSYPTLPPEIDPSAIPAHWKALMERVEPAERGIPLFRNIEITNVKGVGADRAIQMTAFKEKPASGFVFRNVSIKAQRAGAISNASDWRFENVRFDTDDGEPVALQNCKDVAVPTVVKTP